MLNLVSSVSSSPNPHTPADALLPSAFSSTFSAVGNKTIALIHSVVDLAETLVLWPYNVANAYYTHWDYEAKQQKWCDAIINKEATQTAYLASSSLPVVEKEVSRRAAAANDDNPTYYGYAEAEYIYAQTGDETALANKEAAKTAFLTSTPCGYDLLGCYSVDAKKVSCRAAVNNANNPNNPTYYRLAKAEYEDSTFYRECYQSARASDKASYAAFGEFRGFFRI